MWADCPHIVQQSVKDMKLDYSAYLDDERHPSDPHLKGKYHNSMVGPFIFPLRSIDQIVPASLHILLGITLLGYNLMLDECRIIDRETH